MVVRGFAHRDLTRHHLWMEMHDPSGGHMPQKSGRLHDSRVPPDWQCLRSVQPLPSTSGDGNNFAASDKGLCTRRCI